MGGGTKKGKKKKDPAKEAAKRERKALKAEKDKAKRERKLGGENEDVEPSSSSSSEVDIDALLRAAAADNEERGAELKSTKLVDEAEVRRVATRCNCAVATVGKDEVWLHGGEKAEAGDSCKVYGDLYRWRAEKNEWTKIAAPGDAPPPRCAHQLVEVSPGKIVLFGGEFATWTQFRHFNDVWLLADSTGKTTLGLPTTRWERRDGVAGEKKPAARSGHRARAARGHLIIFGGFHKGGRANESSARWFNDCWLYSPSRNAWTEVETCARPGAVRPPPRSACALAYRSQTDTLTVWGGYSEIRCDDTALKAKGKTHVDAWHLDLAPVFLRAASSPGNSASFSFESASSSYDKDALRWERLQLKGEPPSARAGANAAASRNGDLLYVFGGVFDSENDDDKATDRRRWVASESTFFDDVYVLDLGARRWRGPLLRSSTSTIPPDTDTTAPRDKHARFQAAPGARIGAAVALLRDKTLVVVGGTLEVRGDRERTFDDIWTLDVSRSAQADALSASRWTCLLEPTLVAADADAARPEEDDDDDDDDDDEEEEEEDDDDDEEDEGEEEEEEDDDDETKDETKDDDKRVAPRLGEPLRDFFERTRDHWLAQADMPDASEKDLKRAAFQLASACYDERRGEQAAGAQKS